MPRLPSRGQRSFENRLKISDEAAVAKLRRYLLMLGAPIFQNFNGFLDASVNSVGVQAVFGQ